MSKFAGFQAVPVITLDELTQLGDIELGRGNIISKIDIRENSGSYPIYSSSSKNNGMMGRYGKFMFDEEMVTWSVDGGGKFFYRPRHKFSVTNVSGYMRANQEKFAYKFLHGVLDFQHSFLNFDYQSKAHPSVIRELYEVPIPPLPEQKKIAAILTSVDEVIETTQKQIDKLQDLKKATMNELLTKGIGHTEFKDSELGRIPKSWEVGSLRNISDLKVGYAFKSDWFSESGCRLLRGENVGYGVANWKETKFLDRDQAAQYSDYYLNVDDVIIGMDRTFTKSGSKITKISTLDLPCLLVQRVGRFVALNSDIEFLWHVLRSDIYLSQLVAQEKGMDIPHLSKQEILEPIVPVVPIHEQKTIAKILSSFDAQIALESCKLAHTQALKKSLMQDLLTGKVRVKVD